MNIQEARETYRKTEFLTGFSSYPEEYEEEKAQRRRAGGFIEGYEAGVREAEKLVHNRRYKTSMHLSDAILALLGEGK